MTSAAFSMPLGSLAPGGRLQVVRLRRKAVSVADGGEWVSGPDAARLAGVDAATVWRAGDRGDLAYEGSGPPGGRQVRRYRRRDVETWARGRRKIVNRIAELEEARALDAETLARHTAEIADLRRQLADLRGDDAG